MMIQDLTNLSDKTSRLCRIVTLVNEGAIISQSMFKINWLMFTARLSSSPMQQLLSMVRLRRPLWIWVRIKRALKFLSISQMQASTPSKSLNSMTHSRIWMSPIRCMMIRYKTTNHHSKVRSNQVLPCLRRIWTGKLVSMSKKMVSHPALKEQAEG